MSNNKAIEEKTIEQKIAELSDEDKYTFNNGFRAILECRDLSCKYGIKGDDFVNLPEDKVRSAREQFYRERFEQG